MEDTAERVSCDISLKKSSGFYPHRVGQSPFIPVALRANGLSPVACLMNREQEQMAFPKQHSGTPPLPYPHNSLTKDNNFV